jgi:serine/threonine protein kinase
VSKGKDQEKICVSCESSYPAAYSSCPRCQLPLVFPVIGKVWRVDKLIGRGGMGAVFLAHHTEDPHKVSAVKVLQLVVGEQRADRQEKVGRFQREAEALGRLKHPAIVELYDFARERDGTLYMAMEYLQGMPLSRVLSERGPLESKEAVAIILQVLAAVSCAHRVGIIHRDIKPDNIVVLHAPSDGGDSSLHDDRIKVVDFGVARLKDDPATEAGQALGTPVYMAPEQAQGGEIDERVDVYGAAAVLFEMLAGRPPFLPPDGPNANLLLLAKIMTHDPASLRELRPEVSVALESVIERALCRDRTLRYPMVDDFAEALRIAITHPQDRLWTRPAVVPPLSLPTLVAQAVAPSRPTALTRTYPPPVRSSASLPPVMRSGGVNMSRSGIGTTASGRTNSNMQALSQSTSALNSIHSLRNDGVPISSLSSSPSGSYPGGSSSMMNAAPSSSLSAGRSGAVVLPRSSLTPTPGSESSRSASPSPSERRSLTYRILIALLYLAAVSILTFSLLFDRSSCRSSRERSQTLPSSIGGP